MSFPARLHDEVTHQVWLPDQVDVYGDEMPAYENFPRRGLVQQISASEDDVDRETRVTTYRLFLDPSPTVSAKDRFLLADGTPCEVFGEPDVVSDGVGPHHLEVEIRSVAG